MAIAFAVVEGPDAGTSFEVPLMGSFTLGRGKGADQRLTDGQASRIHCRLVAGPEGCSVEDMGSRNGTFLNGRKVVAAEFLRPGDRLWIGESLIVAVALQAPAEPAKENDETAAGDLFCLSCGHRMTGRCGRCGGRFLTPPGGLEKFQIEKRLGRGGMGAVFRAVQAGFGRVVALKVAAFSDKPRKDGVQRFLREAKVLARCDHENIVRIFDTGKARALPPETCLLPGESAGDIAFIAMEYVEGRTLDRVVAEEDPVDIGRAVGIARDVASALAYANERGIVHRDIKPANIIVTDAGEVKITDFGLAKSFENSGLSGITMAGMMLGTPAYMAPEQIRDALRADHRADLYALGATLYFTLAGRPPFAGRGVTGVLRDVLNRLPPPVEDRRPDTPLALRRVLETCMAKDPSKRYPDAASLLADLDAVPGSP